MILVHMGFHKRTITCKRKEIHQQIDSFINLGIWEFLVNFFNFNTKHPVNTDKKTKILKKKNKTEEFMENQNCLFGIKIEGLFEMFQCLSITM